MNWIDYYAGFAEHAAKNSKDSTKVGAVLVGPHGEIRMTGYNGPPKGVKDTPERFERPAKYDFVCHAEANVISFAARSGVSTEGCSLYVTHVPCKECAKLIIQSGIKLVFIGSGTFGTADKWTHDMKISRTMFEEAGVLVI